MSRFFAASVAADMLARTATLALFLLLLPIIIVISQRLPQSRPLRQANSTPSRRKP